MVDSEEEVSFSDRVICDSDVFTTNESENSNDGLKSDHEHEANFEYIESNDNHTIRFVSVPVLQEFDIKASWTRQMTKALIEEYTLMLSQFRDPEKKQKDLWIHLANKLQENGFKVTWQMCDRKFRNLKQTYRTIYYSERTDKSKRRWEFYDDLSSLVSPYSRFTTRKLSSPNSTVNEKYIKLANGAILKATVSEPQEDRPSSPTPTPTPTLEMEHTTSYQIAPEKSYVTESDSETPPPPWFKHFLKQFKSEQSRVLKNIQSMHKETKQIEMKKIKLLENILTLLQSQNNY